VFTVPPVTLICAHWIPIGFEIEAPVGTLWSTQSDSVPPRLRYWTCIITRSARESRLLAELGTRGNEQHG
jgi:hypothetical protein